MDLPPSFANNPNALSSRDNSIPISIRSLPQPLNLPRGSPCPQSSPISVSLYFYVISSALLTPFRIYFSPLKDQSLRRSAPIVFGRRSMLEYFLLYSNPLFQAYLSTSFKRLTAYSHTKPTEFFFCRLSTCSCQWV